MSPAEAAPLFAALGDRTRLALVMRLSDGRRASIAALSVDTGLTRQAVTKHLAVLTAAGLAESERAGRETRFGLRPERLAAARSYLAGVAAQWDATLDRLRLHVEDQPSG